MSKAIIDVDSYLYRAALTCNDLAELQKGVYYEIYDIDKARSYLSEVATTMMEKTGCDEYVFVMGGVGKNFRYYINPNYKSNRKKQARPLMLEKVKEMAINEFPLVYIPCLEADDTCRILMEENKDNVIVSIDKDLRTFPGKIYDSYHNVLKYISPQQAEANFKRQLLIGDKTDGYSGIPRIGPATADKMILDGITIDDIAEKYVEVGLGLDTFELVYNCARIVSRNDYNEGVITLYGGKKFDTRTIGA